MIRYRYCTQFLQSVQPSSAFVTESQYLLIWLVCCVAMVGAQAAERPNVLLICVDDLKPTLGCFSDTKAVTPNIDSLAQRAVRFESAYCNQAVCSPSRNSLMTGLRPQTIGVYDLGTHFRLAAPDVVTLSQHFKNHGYVAQSLGKIYHVGHGNTDDVQSWSVPSWRPKGNAYADPHNLANIKPDKNGKRRGPTTEAADVDDATYGDGKIAREAVRRLQQAATQPEQNFFLAVGFSKPHLPFISPQKYWDLHDPIKLPMPELTRPPLDAPKYAPTTWGELRNYSDIQASGELSTEQTRHLIHGYYAATSYMDAQVGRVLKALDDLALQENTIVVLWGDHGWHLGDHGMWCKHTNYEQAARIPVIVAAPQGARGAASNALIETVDIYPTLAELAGIDIPDALDGRSFAKAVRDPSAAARPAITHVYPRGNRLGRAIRNERFRLVQWKEVGAASDTAEIELYDYQTDPLETRNLAADKPEVVTQLLKILAEQPEPKPQFKAGSL